LSAWLVKRVFHAIVTFTIAAVLMFVLMRLAPGDPIMRADQQPIPPAEAERLRALYGLDQPISQQLITFVSGIIRGDLGISIEHKRPVTALLAATSSPWLLQPTETGTGERTIHGATAAG